MKASGESRDLLLLVHLSYITKEKVVHFDTEKEIKYTCATQRISEFSVLSVLMPDIYEHKHGKYWKYSNTL